jgi:hypothetical protein
VDIKGFVDKLLESVLPPCKAGQGCRGLLTPDGGVHTWKVCKIDHTDGARKLGLNIDNCISFYILPNGDIDLSQFSGKYKGILLRFNLAAKQKIITSIKQALWKDAEL